MSKKPKMMGQYAIQTDHPGLMKDIDKEKTSKVDRSLFMKDKDARKKYIVGVMGSDGRKKSKVEEKIDTRLEKYDW